MNTCQTCRHWGAETGTVREYDELPAAEMIREAREQWDDHTNDEQQAALKDRVKLCGAPRLHFYVAPGDGEAAVIDGSEYKANLCTDQNFGCTLHEPQEAI